LKINYFSKKNKVEQKVVVITGGSSGIGEALAYKFASEQAMVVIGARNTEGLKRVADKILSDGGQAVWLQTDVTKEGDCKNLILKAVDTYGRIDILINNAGVSMRAIFKDVDLNVLKRLMDVNFWGTVYCTKHALPFLLEQKGSVVGVSSVAGYKGLPGRTGYSASKFAMNGFMESLRIENLKTDLHVLMAFPGFTTSNIRNAALNAQGKMQGESPREEGEMMSPQQVAHHIYKAVIKRRSRLILSREGRIIHFLNKLVPDMLNRVIFKQMSKEPDSPF